MIEWLLICRIAFALYLIWSKYYTSVPEWRGKPTTWNLSVSPRWKSLWISKLSQVWMDGVGWSAKWKWPSFGGKDNDLNLHNWIMHTHSLATGQKGLRYVCMYITRLQPTIPTYVAMYICITTKLDKLNDHKTLPARPYYFWQFYDGNIITQVLPTRVVCNPSWYNRNWKSSKN